MKSKVLVTIAVLVAAATLAATLATSSQATSPGRNGRIAYTAPDPDNGRSQVWTATVGHTGAELTQGRYDSLAPAWSPNGEQIAYLRGRYNFPDKRGLYLNVAAADGSGARRLAFCDFCGVPYQSRPSWSPNGSRIVFSGNFGSHGQVALWVVAARGGRPHRISGCRASCADVEPTWSPAGHLLAFQRITATPGASGIYTVRPDGSDLKKIAEGTDPAWSPDGRRIAFDSDAGIKVADPDGSHPELLFAQTVGEGPGIPSWSPNGRKLVFFNTPPESDGFAAEVWTMNADGSAQKRLYGSRCCVEEWAPPIWSPDGLMIAFSANSAGGTFVINADGTGLRRLSQMTAETLSWQRPPTEQRP